jgi:hypothetical protein
MTEFSQSGAANGQQSAADEVRLTTANKQPFHVRRAMADAR